MNYNIYSRKKIDSRPPQRGKTSTRTRRDNARTRSRVRGRNLPRCTTNVVLPINPRVLNSLSKRNDMRTRRGAIRRPNTKTSSTSKDDDFYASITRRNDVSMSRNDSRRLLRGKKSTRHRDCLNHLTKKSNLALPRPNQGLFG